jgi:hypothetical protein
MKMVETRVVREQWDVDRRLSEMGLNRSKLLEVRDVALTSGANATAFHPINAPGTFSYHDGTFALRIRHVQAGGEWAVDRSNGIESIRNDKRKLKIVFANVDIACDDEQKPQPRSPTRGC